MSAIEVENVRKYYGDVRGVDGLSFSVGAGKSTASLGRTALERPQRSKYS